VRCTNDTAYLDIRICNIVLLRYRAQGFSFRSFQHSVEILPRTVIRMRRVVGGSSHFPLHNTNNGVRICNIVLLRYRAQGFSFRSFQHSVEILPRTVIRMCRVVGGSSHLPLHNTNNGVGCSAHRYNWFVKIYCV